MHDLVVIGGGVVGLSIAYELSGRGLDVCLVDQAQPGQEASWAGAGMLPPGNPDLAETPESLLRGASHRLWDAWAAQLQAETGQEIGYHRCGGLEVRFRGHPGELDAEIEQYRRESVAVEPLSAGNLHALESELAEGITAAYRLPGLGQVRNPRYLKALLTGCLMRGVIIHPGTPVMGWQTSGSRVVAAQTVNGTLPAGQFVLAAGAWSSRCFPQGHRPPPVRPMRGQMLLFHRLPRLLSHVITIGTRYLVPRMDGRLLVGSTEEAVGFDKRNTAGGVSELLRFALSVVPGLESATLERTWSGLRPQTPDRLPYLGPLADYSNLLLATGHFRSGLQLSPITARVITELVLGRTPCVPLEAFSPERPIRETFANDLSGHPSGRHFE